MTHVELVKRAARWLRTSKRCALVLSEIATEREAPDAIGWAARGYSILVECKASVEDYKRDATKWFRRMPEHGMGQQRWYFAPPDLATAIAAHLHAGSMEIGFGKTAPALRWGVVACLPRGCRVLRAAEAFPTWNERAERVLLVSACRRAAEGWGRKVFGELAPPLVDGDPHPTTAKVIAALRSDLRRKSDYNSRMVVRVEKLEKEVDRLEAENKALIAKVLAGGGFSSPPLY